MFVIVWEYRVRPGAEEAFATLYGPEGDWAALFRAHPGFLGTELLSGTGAAPWLTIDRWDSEAAWAACMEDSREAYAGLDARGDALSVAERCIGHYRTPC